MKGVKLVFFLALLPIALAFSKGAEGLPTLRANLFSVKTLPTQSQLPVSNIYTVYQDSEGFLWYGTIGGGLCRDNGYQIYTFRPSDHTGTPEADNVLCLAEDKLGNIWFGTDAGLFRLERQSWAISMPHQIQGQVFAIISDAEGDLWVGAGHTIYQLSVDTDKPPYTLTNIPSWRVTSFCEDVPHHRLFALLSGQLAEIVRGKGKNTLRPVTTSLPIDPVCMVQDSNGTYWIATWGDGVVHFDPTTNQIAKQTATTSTHDQSQCLSLTIDRRHGLLWTTTSDNIYVYRIDGNHLVAYDTHHFLTQENQILGLLYEDRTGNVWVPGFIPNTFIVCPERNNMRRITIEDMRHLTGYPLIPDRMLMRGNNVWILQGRMGLMHYDLHAKKLSVAGGMKYSQCMALNNSEDGLLVAHKGYLQKLSPTAPFNVSTLASFPEYITYILDDGKGIIYVATSRAIYTYSEMGQRTKCLCKTMAAAIAMCKLDDTLYYIIKGKGLYKVDTNGESAPEPLLQSAFLSAIALNQDGTLWAVGRNGNVYSVQKDSITIHPEMQNKGCEPLIDVFCDRRGHVWTLSNQRAKEYNPKTYAFRSITNSEAGVAYFFHYEEVDGDSIGIGGAGAFCILPITPELDRSSTLRHTSRVTSILLGDSIRLWNRVNHAIDIPWNQSSVGFHVSNLDVLHADRISYAYRIKELGDNWIHLPQGDNTFYLNNLPYGDCSLELRSTNASGCWQDAEEVLLIHHLRPWWQTWWIWLLFMLITALPLYCLWIISKRMRKMKLWHRQRRELALTEISAPSQQELLAEKDKQFLTAARDCVEHNLANPQYNVESLASDLCMSRSNLHRRLQPLTDLSPIEFIRDIRLKQAAKMISSSPDLPMSEVARRVGYNNSSYFAKCFKARFGVLPTQYVDATNVENLNSATL